MEEKSYWVYILSNEHHTTFYTGLTSDLARRIYEHRHKLADGFTKEYNITKLLYAEQHDDIEEARLREQRIKKWKRDYKVNLITEQNPEWNDLYNTLNT